MFDSYFAGRRAICNVWPMNKFLPTARFDTDLIEQDYRFEAWRAIMSASHDIGANPDGFFGRLSSTRFGDMIVHVMETSPISTERGGQKVKRDGLEHFVLHVNTMPARAEADGRELSIPSAHMSINDLSRTSRRALVPERGSILLSMSRDLIREAGVNTDRLHGSILNQGAGALLISHLRELARLAPTIEATAAIPVAKATAQLVAACIAATSENIDRARPQIENAVLVRARSFIEANLGSRTLGPETVSKALNTSRATLYRLFEPFGGVSSYILKRRLNAARRRLERDADTATISAIAASLGFAADAHFSREFKRAFGVRPREFQREGVPGNEVVEPADNVVAHWIRSIG